MNLLILFLFQLPLSRLLTESTENYDYCIIGAGPGGIQMSYFLQSSNRNYIVYERSSVAGSFYQKYPRHRTLLSINKRFTGRTNTEFNLRHDWNSLLSNNLSLRFTHYSTQYYPNADDLVHYFNDYAENLNLNIKYNHSVFNIKLNNDIFELNITNNITTNCIYLLLATGHSLPNIPSNLRKGIINHTIGYEDINLDPEYYYNKSVAILGSGNTAFEIADSIIDYTQYITIFTSSYPKLTYLTHYVGDIRAINSRFLDQYQLKSLDNIVTLQVLGDGRNSNNPASFSLTNCGNDTGGGIRIAPNVHLNADKVPSLVYNCWDIIIRALGWTFDSSIFTNSNIKPNTMKKKNKIFLDITTEYEISNIPNMYVIGELMHSRDYRKAAGGFIHGYRYLIKSLYNILEYKNHKINMKSKLIPNKKQLMKYIIKRVNEASAPYQMYSFIGDVMIFDNDIKYVEDILLETLFNKKQSGSRSDNYYGIPIFDRMEDSDSDYYGIPFGIGNDFITWTFQYGDDYSGCKVIGPDRVLSSDPYSNAHCSGFLHPVFKFYHNKILCDEFHLIEDIGTDWTKEWRHIKPLKQWLSRVYKKRRNNNWNVETLPECVNDLDNDMMNKQSNNYHMKKKNKKKKMKKKKMKSKKGKNNEFGKREEYCIGDQCFPF